MNDEQRMPQLLHRLQVGQEPPPAAACGLVIFIRIMHVDKASVVL